MSPLGGAGTKPIAGGYAAASRVSVRPERPSEPEKPARRLPQTAPGA